MPTLNPNYITDNTGKKISVVLPMKDYKAILEELEDIKLYEKAKKSKQEFVDAEQAFKEIEKKREKKKK